MFDPIKAFRRLDALDPRLSTVPKLDKKQQLEILGERKEAVETILLILDDDKVNPVRFKAQSTLEAIEEAIGKIKYNVKDGKNFPPQTPARS